MGDSSSSNVLGIQALHLLAPLFFVFASFSNMLSSPGRGSDSRCPRLATPARKELPPSQSFQPKSSGTTSHRSRLDYGFILVSICVALIGYLWACAHPRGQCWGHPHANLVYQEWRRDGPPKENSGAVTCCWACKNASCHYISR